MTGRLSAFDAGVYLIIHLQSDFRTGVWTGSAARLMGTAPRGTSLRDMQRALNRLAQIGFIRPLHRHGVRGNYRVLIHKYEPQFGALKGKRLNATKSESWQHPVYEDCAVTDAVTDAVTGTVDAPYQEVLSSNHKKTCVNPSGSHGAVPPSTPHPDHEQVIRRVWEYYLEKLDKNPKLLPFSPLRNKKAWPGCGSACPKQVGTLKKPKG